MKEALKVSGVAILFFFGAALLFFLFIGFWAVVAMFAAGTFDYSITWVQAFVISFVIATILSIAGTPK